MSALPRPDDPELEVMWEREAYEQHFAAAREAVRSYPDAAARVIAEFWMQSSMLEMLRGTIP